MDYLIRYLSGWHQFLLVLTRFIIGWHLFYQGLGKLRAVSWSSKWYLENARGPLAGFFQWIAESPWFLDISDTLTVWGLLIIGLLLMLGLFTRTAAAGGAALLLLFYLAAPPLPVQGFTVPTAQGTELYVDKTLIEALALLLVMAFPTGQIAGLDILIRHWRKGRDRYFTGR